MSNIFQENVPPKKAVAHIALFIILSIILLPPVCLARIVNSHSVGTLFADTIPPRPLDAISGSEFARRTTGMPGADRQRAALEELQRGNIPEFIRTLKPVQVSFKPAKGEPITGIIWVMPDYLSIGSDKDFLRIPLTYPSAVKIANAFGFVLPTQKVVDAISEQSTFHLKPQPLPPGPKMRSSRYYLRHQKKIEAQLVTCPPGELISGHKKDIVLTNRLYEKPHRIAIYGWHRRNGQPIQPLSIVHGERYADYSHGVRLVSTTIWINGKPRSIFEVLENPALAKLLNYEGVISDPRGLMHCQN